MKYLVTGAAGHLGNTIVKQLTLRGETVRCLVMPHELGLAELPEGAEIFTGNVLDPDSMKPFFSHGAEERIKVIHCAGIVSIASKYQQDVYDVNVTGTKNIIELCKKYRADKLIYVSSVHAITEKPRGTVMRETKRFDPESVRGCYAKTKAEATDCVLEAASEGLCACVVHPSGICGPGDYGRGHVTQLLTDFCNRKLTAGIRGGGYDFVDVRDVAAGIISCCERGRAGETYILSNRYYSVPGLLSIFHDVTGRKPVRTFLPMWFAKGTAGMAEIFYKIVKQTPLYTPYSMFTLTSNSSFSHEKAERELGYSCRPMEDTIRDTYEWLKLQGRIGPAPAEKRVSRARRPSRKPTV